MPFVLDVPTRILPAGVSLQLICVDLNRSAPLLYLAHASPSGHQVFVAQLSWSYLATPSVQQALPCSNLVHSSALDRVISEVVEVQ